MDQIDKNSKIYVAGHAGMVGSAIVRNLQAKGYRNILVRTRSELDLLNKNDVDFFLNEERPDYIFIAAAKVGGIAANDMYRADFLYQNLMIELNLINGAHKANVNRLCFLGSSCIYPRDCEQPIKENYLLKGPLEHTNEPYAIAKIAGVKLCECYNDQYSRSYISVMPTNLYGPNDNYDLINSHVLPAIIRKVHEAKVNNKSSITVWGDGTPRREFLYVEDLAEACVFLMEVGYVGSLLNVGTGEDISIKDLVQTVMTIVGYTGLIEFDKSKPNGTPRKRLDVSRVMKLGWTPRTNLQEGIYKSYEDFKKSL